MTGSIRLTPHLNFRAPLVPASSAQKALSFCDRRRDCKSRNLQCRHDELQDALHIFALHCVSAPSFWSVSAGRLVEFQMNVSPETNIIKAGEGRVEEGICAGVERSLGIERHSRTRSHLTERNLILCPGRQKLGRARGLMSSHLLSVLEPSVVLQVNRDAGCSPGVTSDRGQNEQPGPLPNRSPGVVPVRARPVTAVPSELTL